MALPKQPVGLLNRLPGSILKLFINLWPPFFGAGIKVKTLTKDFSYVEVCLKPHWYNKNYIGTHFGGSMFSMTDPFYMLMLIKVLGPDYIVLDKTASIEFIKKGYGVLTAIFKLSSTEINAIRESVDAKTKTTIIMPVIDIINTNQEIVAKVTKEIYIKRKIAKT